jgi:hypothetical protein
MAAAIVMVGALGMVLPAPAAQAATEPWGYASTPKLADGSLDFSGWTPIPLS